MRVAHRVSRGVALLGGMVVLVITLLISYDVGMRYLFDDPQLFVDELAGFLQVFVIFSGLAYAFTKGTHVRVDLLTAQLRPARRAGLRLASLLAGVLVILIVTWVTATSAFTAYDYGRVSTVEQYPLWLPMAMIPLGLGFLAWVMLAALRKQWRILRGDAAQIDEIALIEEAL